MKIKNIPQSSNGTGAVDINGKDIYEGDFVKGILANEYGAIYWNTENLWFAYISNKLNTPVSKNLLQTIEVVGNIYQGVK